MIPVLPIANRRKEERRGRTGRDADYTRLHSSYLHAFIGRVGQAGQLGTAHTGNLPNSNGPARRGARCGSEPTEGERERRESVRVPQEEEP